MGYIVKDVDIHKEKHLLLNILKANRERPEFPYEQRFDWLYYDNPFGEARAWIIWDEAHDYPAGFTAVFPRKVLVNHKEYICWNCGDFSIEKKYRSLGIAVKLRKAAKECVDRGMVPFLYAHPNNRMVHVHLRAGHKKIAQMKRFALPLKISNYIQNPNFPDFIGNSLDRMMSGVLKIRHRNVGEYATVSKKEMHFGVGHQNLCSEVNDTSPVVGLRNREYLNWKFRNHPVAEPELFNYYEKGVLAGYVISAEENGSINVLEWMSKNNPETQKNLISVFVHHCLRNRSKCHVISSVLQEFHPIVPVLKGAGFKFRDDATNNVIAYCGEEQLKPIVEDGKNWFMSVGDRDS